MKEFIKCRDYIIRKKDIKRIEIYTNDMKTWYVLISLNTKTYPFSYIELFDGERSARKEYNSIYKQLQEEVKENE